MEEYEEWLECSCELLTTDGKDIEKKNQDLSEHLSKIKEISQKTRLGFCCGLQQTYSRASGSLEEIIQIPIIRFGSRRKHRKRS
jgi:iron-sulfur cluster repair protein YtfE (RIC family)